MNENYINDLYSKAIEFKENQEYTNARKCIEKILNDYPENFTEDNYGEVFSFQDVLELYLYTLILDNEVNFKQSPIDNSGIYQVYAEILIAQNEFDKAIKSLEISLKWDPVNVEALLMLADGYSFKGIKEKSINCILKALDFSVNCASLGRAYRSLGDYFYSEQQYEEAVCTYLISSSYLVRSSIKDIGEIEEKISMIEKETSSKINIPTLKRAKEIMKSKGVKVGPGIHASKAVLSLRKDAEEREQTNIVNYCNDIIEELEINSTI